MKKFIPTTYYLLPTNREGQSLLEILVALGVGTLLIIAATTIILPSLRTNTQADKVQVSAALGKQLLENVRVFGEGDWHNVSGLATSSANKYFLVPGSPFVAATGTEGISADGITSGLVGYWKLDESTGTTAYDFSGNGNSGTWNGTSSFAATGQIGGAWQFNGSTSYVDIPNSSMLNPTAITVSAWVKLSNLSGTYPSVISKPAAATWSSPYARYNLRLNTASTPRWEFWANDYDNGTNIGVTAAVAGAWTYVAGTYDGTTESLYVNGALDHSNPRSGAISSSTYDLAIGSHGTGGNTGEMFPGIIDDVRIYNRALSATEIKSIYNAGIYTRYFYLDSVGRDGSGNILSSGGTNDPSTKKTTVVYGWASGSTSSFSTYLTRFQNKVFDQTDWSGGPGQEGPATTTNNMFSTSTLMFYATTTGSIMIQLP